MPSIRYPQRIVCLAAEAPEILYRLGAFDRIVGVSGFARRPEAVKSLPKVGGFAQPDVERVLALQPDLVITISDIQAEAAATLIKQGVPVLALNPHRLEDVWRNILVIGGAVGAQRQAELLVASLQAELAAIPLLQPLPRRPRVFFEEWPDPLVSGIGWVGDLIRAVGGEDLFPELADQPKADGRVVTPEAVAAREPEVVLASWCGKPADLEAIRRRPAWQRTPAVRHGHIYEVSSDLILQTGPSLIEGARQIYQRLLEATTC